MGKKYVSCKCCHGYGELEIDNDDLTRHTSFVPCPFCEGDGMVEVEGAGKHSGEGPS